MIIPITKLCLIQLKIKLRNNYGENEMFEEKMKLAEDYKVRVENLRGYL